MLILSLFSACVLSRWVCWMQCHATVRATVQYSDVLMRNCLAGERDLEQMRALEDRLHRIIQGMTMQETLVVAMERTSHDVDKKRSV